MQKWKNFECCSCHEPFTYEPSAKVKNRLEELQLSSGRKNWIMVDCPHCPAQLRLDLANGSVDIITDQQPPPHSKRYFVWDWTLTEKNKDKVEHLNEKGDQLMGKGEHMEARKCFLNAIQLRKHDPQSWYNYGVSLVYANERLEAIDAFRHALQYDPEFVNAWNNLGMLLLAEGKIDDASECFVNGINADPDYPKCYLGLANVYAIHGNLTEAKRFIEIAIEKDPYYDKAKEALKNLESHSQQ